jgi:hypothetical protein
MATRKVCFFITPIGQPNSPERKRADNIKKYVLSVLSRSYSIIRADELPRPGSITHQVIKLLYEADLVIAELTGANPNVVYELALRHAFNKVSIHLVDEAADIPFDLRDERTVVFDITDPESINACRQELRRYLKEIGKKKFSYTSPVFRVLGVAAATAEQKEDFLETIADQISSIASDVSSIEFDVGFIESEISSANLAALEDMVEELKSELSDVKGQVGEILGKLEE